jgi:hypothetical protein
MGNSTRHGTVWLDSAMMMEGYINATQKNKKINLCGFGTFPGVVILSALTHSKMLRSIRKIHYPSNGLF